MPCLKAAFVAGMMLAVAPPASAAPVPAGHYRYELGAADVIVDVRIADDGREFVGSSWMGMTMDCGDGEYPPFTNGVDLAALPERHYRAVQITPRGTFRFSRVDGDSRYALSGRFAGAALHGRITIRHPGCARTAVFDARLAGPPSRVARAQVRSCDRVTIASPPRGLEASEEYALRTRGIGCTGARELARRWRHAPECRSLGLGQTCHVRGASCRAVHGGRYLSLASARCRVAGHRARAVELVHRVPCKPASNESTAVWLWAVNIGCAAASAFPVEAMLPSQDGEVPGACGDLLYGHGRCRSLAGFTCSVRESRDFYDGGFHARCTSDRDPFQVLELDYEY